jgi:hypothetical protein
MPPTKDYEIPRFGLPTERILPWLLEATQEGEAWLKAQQPTGDWDGVRQLLSATDGTEKVEGLSSVGYNKAKRTARELVASLANFRHEGEYTVSWDQKLFDTAAMLTSLDRNWADVTNANIPHRAALQYAVGFGTGYLFETWDKHYWSPFAGDIRLDALAPGDVTFVQLPKNHDIQRAYMVIIREELPINLAKAIYGQSNEAFAKSLVPDRDAPGWLLKGLRKVQQFLSPALRVGGRAQMQDNASFPTVDIFHAYTLDQTTNTGSAPVQMGPWAQGRPIANWAYKVPALGDPMPSWLINPETGSPYTMPAGPAECRLFPLRRYTIFSRTAIAYDGTSPWWHGAVPLARIRFNDWAWEALGASLIGELKTMQEGIVEIMRAIEDSAAARLNPARIYDENLVSQGFAKAFNPRMAGVAASANLQQGKPIEFPVPVEYYNVPEWMTSWIESQEERMDYISGVRDLVAVSKAQQIPGADTLEKLMEMAGPIVQDLVRQVATPLWELGEWRKAYYFQFYTRARMIKTQGPDGVDLDKQYLPESLVPLALNEETEQMRSRVMGYLPSYRYRVTESGINEIHRMTTKLFYIQLMKEGFPISWWTFAKIAQIPNFGPAPEGTNTEMERWIAQEEIKVDMQVNLAMRQQELMGGMMGAEGNTGDPNQPDAEGATGPAGGGGPGRPQSYKKAPKLQSKDGGTRSTITTS